MKLSAKTEYAALAMLELALRSNTGEPVRIREIADTHGIPSRFLVQILLQLKNAGLVSSTRGAAGGYQLHKSPESISLSDIVGAVEGIDTELTSNTPNGNATVNVLLATWRKIHRAERDLLSATTLADLAEKASRGTSPMYYI